jgi:hypothetical protein
MVAFPATYRTSWRPSSANPRRQRRTRSTRKANPTSAHRGDSAHVPATNVHGCLRSAQRVIYLMVFHQDNYQGTYAVHKPTGDRLALMRPNRLRTWVDWYEEFLRTGLFSLRPLPKNQAERELEPQETPPSPKDVTRLNLECGDENGHGSS